VSADEKPLLDGLWDSFSLVVFNSYDSYGWILPALLLTILLLGVLLLFAWATEDLPIDVGIFETVSDIFKWSRRRWKGN
jgi:hypothetical protein